MTAAEFMRVILRRRRIHLGVVALGLCWSHGNSRLWAAPASASATVPTPLALQPEPASDVVHLEVGRSVLLRSSNALRRVYVANPAVLQTYTAGADELVLTAKAAGASSLVLWDEAGGHRMYSVYADLDADAVRRALEAAFPNSTIHVETGEGKVLLTGSVETQAVYEGAAKIAGQYSRDVVNSLRIVPSHGKQVELKVRIVEVDRTRLEQLGINIFAGGRTAVSTTTGQFGSSVVGPNSAASVVDPLNLFLYNAKVDLGVTVRDLEQKQVLQVLAEPTLTTLSGLPARFLSGGEFPFPVVEGGANNTSAITIQFRPYGVKVDFTPDVNADGTIHIKLAPEVSTLDYSNAVTISGFTIPALSTRRSETEVEIQDGQSFAVSGLLDHRTTEILSKMPGIADVPVLGQLFRSKNVNRSVVELMVIVTAKVVNPLTANAQKPEQPTFVLPNLDPAGFDRSVNNGAKPEQSGPTGQSPAAADQGAR